ncbi:DUF3289 family protein [Aeromonas sp.]|uniref:DUF3289 family protein n=1 Tax=Aeromonas sp. TaxID=647 RepID=UPI00258E7E3B|nr:DUF3289 family protein [Aeromonas sp.]MCX7128050.1 DUF3289 family protein [Aeromonas sp.]
MKPVKISELSKDQFKQIVSPWRASQETRLPVEQFRTGDLVFLQLMSTSHVCKITDDKIYVEGDAAFRDRVQQAYAKAPATMWFGSAEMKKPPSEEPTVKQQLKTDTTSAVTFRLPVQIYKSPRDPGKSASGTTADDMIYGDMTAAQIEQIPTVWSLFKVEGMNGLATASPDRFFQSFRDMAITLFSAGELKMNTLEMIAKFQKKEGGEYRNPVLTRNVRAHESTIAFTNTIITEVKRELKAKDGDVNALVLDDLMKRYKKADAKFRLPRFNNKLDIVSGLTIAINDTWAGEAKIVKYEKFGDFYKGVIKVTLYDHFGLDLPDVGPDPTTGEIKPYGALAGFRSWFILQHLDRFAYKPFITVMEMDYPFSGELK